MKRFLSIFLVFLIAGISPLTGQEKQQDSPKESNKQNSMEMSIHGGVSKADKDYVIKVGDTEMESRNNFLIGGQILYNFNKMYGTGFEVSYFSFGSDDETFYSYQGAVKDKVETNASMLQFFWVNRFAANLSNNLRLYIPVALGLASYKGKVYKSRHILDVFIDDNTENVSSVKPAFYTGLGFEVDLKNNSFIALEGRYTIAKMSSKFTDISTLKNIDVLFKFGMRF